MPLLLVRQVDQHVAAGPLAFADLDLLRRDEFSLQTADVALDGTVEKGVLLALDGLGRYIAVTDIDEAIEGDDRDERVKDELAVGRLDLLGLFLRLAGHQDGKPAVLGG